MNRRQALQLAMTGPSAWAAAGPCEPKIVHLPLDLSGMPVPVYQNGYLAILDSDRMSVQLIDTEGKVAHRCRFVIPKAMSSMTMGLAVSVAGSIVTVSSARMFDGAMGTVLAFADPGAPPSRFFALDGFGAARVAFLPDGNVVCLGREFDSNFNEVPGHDVFRVYSPVGKLLQKALPVEKVRPDRKGLHPNQWMLSVDPGRSRIALVDDERLLYCELDYDGRLVRPVEPLPAFEGPVRVTGFAIAANGDRIIGVDHGDTINGKTSFGFRGTIYRFRGPANTLDGRVVVDESQRPKWASGSMVLGADRQNLALLLTPRSSMALLPGDAC